MRRVDRLTLFLRPAFLLAAQRAFISLGKSLSPGSVIPPFLLGASCFYCPPLALPNEPWRRLQVWLESRPTSGGDLRELEGCRGRPPRIEERRVFQAHRFVGESRWLLVKLLADVSMCGHIAGVSCR